MHDIDTTRLESEPLSLRQEIEASEFEFLDAGELESPFSEVEEMELASELLAVSSEAELDQFLGDLFKKAVKGIRKAGLGASGGLFPVQTLKPMPGIDPHALHGRLQQMGVQTVLHSKPDGNGARLGFILTARHSPEEIDAAVAVVVDALGHQRSSRKACKMEVHK